MTGLTKGLAHDESEAALHFLVEKTRETGNCSKGTGYAGLQTLKRLGLAPCTGRC